MSIHVFDQDRGLTFEPITDRLETMFAQLTHRYRRWQCRRTIEAELSDYTPAELAELGITEADVCRIARDGSR